MQSIQSSSLWNKVVKCRWSGKTREQPWMAVFWALGFLPGEVTEAWRNQVGVGVLELHEKIKPQVVYTASE